jgi:Na+/H+ antiporter NhaA
MAMAVAIYLAFNAGEPSAEGWAAAMSTDTAFALGLLARARLPTGFERDPRLPRRRHAAAS